ncbi:MAG: hypothetical protein AMXMBFR13_26490 [Phycisphaerae bacterium]
MRTDPTAVRPMPAVTESRMRGVRVALTCSMIAGALAGCDRTILDAPTGQEVVPWAQPFDRDAMRAAAPYYIHPDLTGYNFALLMIIQNFNESGVALTLEVNGLDFERRYIPGLTQEVFNITNDMVLQTEAALGLSSAAVDPRMPAQPCPFVVRLKKFVSEDGYVIQNTDSVLAPENIFESMSSKEDNPLDTGFTLDAHHVCPGAFVLVIKQGHVDVIEMDREFVGLNEPDDDEDLVIDFEVPDDLRFIYHAETVEALNRLGMPWLVGSG